jgi:hypothetical protein
VFGRQCSRRIGGTPALLLLALGSLSPSLCAQKPLDREIAFVRALAREMRFIELAQEEAERLAAEYRGAGDQDKIAQLGVEISYYGARSRADREQQRTLFKEAIDKSKELIERSSDAQVQTEARTTLANASQDFGQFLVEEIEIARNENPEQITALEQEAAEVFRAGIDACSKVMESMKSRLDDPEKWVEYHLLWMRKGVLMREQARAVKADREVLIERAIGELTEMVLEVGEETAIGLRGLFEIAQCHEVEGKVADAIDLYRGTIEQIAASLNDADELGLTGEMQAFLFEMMQEVYVRTGEVMAREGAEGTAKLFATFRENVKKYGEQGRELLDAVNDQWGHLMLLSESRFLAESGDAAKVQEALATTQRINERHANDYVGVKAKAVLRDILAVQRSLVSSALLLEVAKGEYQNKNYEVAVKGLRRAIGAMTPEELKKHGLDAFQMLGTSFGVTDRLLESILAFNEGLQRFGEVDKDRSSDAAVSLDRAMSAHKRVTKNDPFFDPLYAQASSMIARYSVTGGSKLFWKGGNDLFNEKNYQEAAAEYAKVQPDFLYYEQARVRIGKAKAALGDFAGARQALNDYRQWADANPIDPRDTAKRQVRDLALAEAEFTEVQMLYQEARGSEEFHLAKDLTKYPAAIERARTFVANFAKDGDVFIPFVLEYLGRLHSDVGELAKAEEAYRQLKPKDPVRASRMATEIFQEYQNQVKSLSAELDAAIAKDRGDAAISTARAAVDAVRTKLVGLGTDYIDSSPKPQIAILVNTMLAYEQLGDWKRVEAIARKTLELYGDDKSEATARIVDQLVLPKVGEALLQQQRFQEAYDMLIAAEKANPNHWEIKRQICRALGGWFEISRAGAPVRIPGLDKPDEAYKKYYGEYRSWGLRPEVKQYSLEWYRFQWEAYWFARKAGEKDSQFKDIADKIYRIAKSTDDFATLKSYGADGLTLFRNFQINR